MTDRFQGFDKPTENWSKLPHALINRLPDFTSQGEIMVVLYILRHTWGFQEFDEGKKITLDEFELGRKRRNRTRLDNGVGMSRAAIKLGIKKAIEHGFIEVEEDNRDAARCKRWYKLCMNQGVRNTPSEVTIRTPGGNDSSPRTEKDTIERNEGKKQPVSRKRKAKPNPNPFSEALARPHIPANDTPIERIRRTLALALEVALPTTDHMLKPYDRLINSVVDVYNNGRPARDRKPLNHDQAAEVVKAIEWCVTEATQGGKVRFPWNGSSVTAPVVNQVVTALTKKPWIAPTTYAGGQLLSEDNADYRAWQKTQGVA